MKKKEDDLGFFSEAALREVAAQRGGIAKPKLERKILRALVQHRDPKTAISILKLRSNDFLLPASCAVFSAVENLTQAGHEISVENLEDEIERDGKLELVGGRDFIRRLVYEIDLEPQHPGLLEKRVRQQRLVAFTYLAGRALSESQAKLALDGDPTAVSEVGQKLTELKKDCFPGQDRDYIGENALIELYRDMELETDDSLHFSTGYSEIDRFTPDGLGWRKGTLCILLGASGVGKTWTMMNFARHANAQGKAVLILSGEMDNKSLMKRFVCADLRVPSWKIRQGMLNLAEWERFAKLVERVAESDWMISCDRPSSWGKSHFEAKMEIFKAKYGKYPDIVFLDHFHQWIYAAGDKVRGRYTPAPVEGEYAIILRDLAIEYELQFVALAQTNKDSAGGKLQPTSIKGSNATYEIADMAIAINRPDLFDKNAPRDVMELTFIKNREGPTGEDIYLSCDPECYRLG